MLCVFDDRQLLHRPLTRLAGGSLVPCPETPERVAQLLEAVRRLEIPVGAPAEDPDAVIAAVHDPDYVAFLREGFAAWKQVPGAGPEMRASLHPTDEMARRPKAILGLAGYYQADSAGVMVEGTWEAAHASARTAVDAMQRVLDGAGTAYALCRPPGHHAYRAKAGGFCYLNNTALAVQRATDHGHRVAVIDVDVHHGNGTQAIFYTRPDVLTVSVHADPAVFYPFYAGYADEHGAGAGEGANLNLPVALHSDDAVYLAAVRAGLDAVERFGPDVVVVALGLDASQEDPFACMQVTADGFRRMGRMIRQGTGTRPSLIVQEGGYPSPGLGGCLEAFLRGWLGD